MNRAFALWIRASVIYLCPTGIGDWILVRISFSFYSIINLDRLF